VASHFRTPPKAWSLHTKKIVGEGALAQLLTRVVIATIRLQADPNGCGPALNRVGLPRKVVQKHVKEVAEASLKRSRTDVIDLFYQTA